jgi:phosphatidylserine decarboxylase
VVPAGCFLTFLNAVLDKASVDNEPGVLHLRPAGGEDVTGGRIAGLLARRILDCAREGDSLARGERFGLVRFGSRADVYWPSSALVSVVIGEKVYASPTISTELPASSGMHD